MTYAEIELLEIELFDHLTVYKNKWLFNWIFSDV